MIDGQFALAFTTGMIAAVNPCGFAMLPAYLSFFLGRDGSAGSDIEAPGAAGAAGGRTGTLAAVARALLVSAAMTAGFVVVFTVVGIVVRNGIRAGVTHVSGWVTVVFASAMIAVGIAVIAGWQLPWSTPKLARGGRSGSLASMSVFGMSYAVASLGCALPIFVGNVINSARRSGLASGVLAMVLYAAGMGLVITALTVSLAVANGGLVRLLRRAMRYVDRLAGAFLAVAGIYLVIYGIEEIRLGSAAVTTNRVTQAGQSVSTRFQNFLLHQDPVTFGLFLAMLVGAAVVVVLFTRRRTGASTVAPTAAPGATSTPPTAAP